MMFSQLRLLVAILFIFAFQIQGKNVTSFLELLHNWSDRLSESTLEDAGSYFHEVHHTYHTIMDQGLDSTTYEDISYQRSLWAKKCRDFIFDRIQHSSDARDLNLYLDHLIALRELMSPDQTVYLGQLKGTVDWHKLFGLVAHFGYPNVARDVLMELNAPDDFLRILGPAKYKRIAPFRAKGSENFENWAEQSSLSEYHFVDGNPDHVFYRGVELRSGDIALMRLNRYGDGVLGSFLVDPFPLGHAMLFVTRRVRLKDGKTRLLPSMIEIFEGGWRSVPLSTAMHPDFHWYTEWVRPRIDGHSLPGSIGADLSRVLDSMEMFAFDFRSRPVPSKADFGERLDGSTATCTSLVRIPLIRAGVDGLPFPTTPVHPGACRNLSQIGLDDVRSVHTPADILLRSGYEYVGFMDNANPEAAYAQRLVLGRPEIFDSLGGWMSQREIQSEKLPAWHMVHQWRAAWHALEVAVGQSDSILGRVGRSLAGVSRAAVPRSASPAVIAFYLESELEARRIVEQITCPLVFQLTRSTIPGARDLHDHPDVSNAVRQSLKKSAIERNGWYQ